MRSTSQQGRRGYYYRLQKGLSSAAQDSGIHHSWGAVFALRALLVVQSQLAIQPSGSKARDTARCFLAAGLPFMCTFFCSFLFVVSPAAGFDHE